MKWPLLVLGAVALASLVWGTCAGMRADRAEATRDSALAVAAFKDSVARVAFEAGVQYAAEADSLGKVAAARGRRADSLTAILRRPKPPIPLPDTTIRDSLRFWRDSAGVAQATAQDAIHALDARDAEVGDLKQQLEAQEAATARFRVSYKLEKDRADGLEIALRKMPSACPRFLGLPRPRLVVGGALTTQGVVPAVALGVPLGC